VQTARGGLLREIGPSGVIILKDFTSTLSMPSKARNALLAALREIYDGCWVRRIGTDGGTTLEWKGKVGIVGGCTPAIDNHHGLMNAMGQRFLFYRMQVVEDTKLAMAALKQTANEDEMHEEMATAVRELIDSISLTPREVSDDCKQRIVSLSILAARCRSSVERDNRNREISMIPQSEAPGRLVKQIDLLFKAVLALGATVEHAHLLVQCIALDSIPPVRRLVFDVLRSANKELTTAYIAGKIQYPEQTTRRALEDLEAHGVLGKSASGSANAYYWTLSDLVEKTCKLCKGVFDPVPEK
jgi:hypothetical protein